MPKTKVPAKDARAISRRLKGFAQTRYGSWAEFLRQLDIGRTTGVAWARVKKAPSVPEVPLLLRLARETNVSLDWLLLGDGPELREGRGISPADSVEAAIEAELRQSESVDPEHFEAAWGLLMLQGQSERNSILDLAVEGVRPRFLECVRLADHYARLVVIYNHMRISYEGLHAANAEQAETSLREFQKLWGQLLPPTLHDAGQSAGDSAPVDGET
jgi:hypothetical protein